MMNKDSSECMGTNGRKRHLEKQITVQISCGTIKFHAPHISVSHKIWHMWTGSTDYYQLLTIIDKHNFVQFISRSFDSLIKMDAVLCVQ